jgi:hypothetical protein
LDNLQPKIPMSKKNNSKKQSEDQDVLDEIKHEENSKLLPKEMRVKMSVKERNLLHKKSLRNG